MAEADALVVRTRARVGRVELSRALAGSTWQRRERPFPHVVARDVFVQPVYRRLADAFQKLLDRGFRDAPTGRFGRTLGAYDAWALHFAADHDGPLALLFSRGFCDVLARAAGVRVTRDVNVGLHHHQVGSASGSPHNDLNPGWFVERRRPDGINLMDHAACSYHHGTTTRPGERPRERVRAVAMIYYLNNPAWRDGDGGETGLYQSARDPVEKPAVAVPPVNNSLLLFECTPRSYHAFIANRRHVRNSVILWLHRSKEEAVARFGEDAIVYWK